MLLGLIFIAFLCLFMFMAWRLSSSPRAMTSRPAVHFAETRHERIYSKDTGKIIGETTAVT